MMAMWLATKMSYQLTLKMLVKLTVYKKSLISRLLCDRIQPNVRQNDENGWATKASHQLTLKMLDKVTFHRVISQLLLNLFEPNVLHE